MFRAQAGHLCDNMLYPVCAHIHTGTHKRVILLPSDQIAYNGVWGALAQVWQGNVLWSAVL
jgi:hypothetical protein